MKDTVTAGFGPDLAVFDWADPLRLSDQLSDDQRMLARSVTR